MRSLRSKQNTLKYILLFLGAFCLSQNDTVRSLIKFWFSWDGNLQKKNGYHKDSIIRKLSQEEFDSLSDDEMEEEEPLLIDSEGEQNVECKNYQLKNRVGVPGGKVACKRLTPDEESCKIAQEIFTDTFVVDCSKEEREWDICQLQGTTGRYMLSCNVSLCTFPIMVGMIPYSTGKLTWQKFHNLSAFRNATENLLEPSNIQKHYGMVFFKCPNDGFESYLYEVVEDLPQSSENFNVYYWDSSVYKTQLLPLPPSLYMKESLKSLSKGDYSSNININMIFIDSISRSHFHRSLPDTVEVFESINRNYIQANHRSESNLVLDFELFQSLRSRTFETLQALFAGYVNPFKEPFGILSMPPQQLATEVVFGPAKKLGYHTLWIEDLCWLWEWGISKDLKAFNKSLSHGEIWSALMNSLRKAGIDSLGITLSACEILRANGVKDPFHGPDAVCYGGKYQHIYNLKYLRDYQEYLIQNKQSFFSFFQTNVNHDESGIRIRPMDKSLADYLKFAAQLDNTITIIFSDHGNTYGEFTEKTMEGRVEIYHPAMFMLLPKTVRKQLGGKKINSLIGNQDKLISILDVHFMLRDLFKISTPMAVPGDPVDVQSLYKVSNSGLFSPVSPSRSCDDMPRIMPHLCICEGYENSEKNDSYHAMYAHFATARLNEVLHSQYKLHHPDSRTPYGRCRPLVAKEFRNVKSSFEPNNTQIVKMDIYVQLFDNQKTDIFFVALKINQKKNAIELTRFDRVTAYNSFKTCNDPGVELTLCVCDIRKTSEEIINLPEIPVEQRQPVLAKLSLEYVEESVKCVYLLTTENHHFIFVEAVNVCHPKTAMLNVKFHHYNMFNMIKINLKKIILKASEVKLIIAAMQKNRSENIKWNIKLSFQWL